MATKNTRGNNPPKNKGADNTPKRRPVERIEPATARDSLTVRQSSLDFSKLMNNPKYKKVNSKPVTGDVHRENFENASNFKKLNKSQAVVPKTNSKGSTIKTLSPDEYREVTDRYKYNQRESSANMLDLRLPKVMYDNRIQPQEYVTYENVDKNDPMYGDIIETPLYDAVKTLPKGYDSTGKLIPEALTRESLGLNGLPLKPQLDNRAFFPPNNQMYSAQQKYVGSPFGARSTEHRKMNLNDARMLRNSFKDTDTEKLTFNPPLPDLTVPDQYALGGDMKQNNSTTDLNEFNTGGRHEDNPLGGIPQGVGANGLPNTVEQGETKKGDFVYSDRINVPANHIKQIGIPPKLQGKTFAEASKIINREFQDRNDPISLKTKTAMLDRLAQSQETIKAEQQAKQAQIQEAMMANSEEVPDMSDGQIPQGMEEFMPQMQQAKGGFLGEPDPYVEWKRQHNLKESQDYNLRRAYELDYTPDENGHLPTVDSETLRFLKKSNHPTIKLEEDWYNSNDPEAVEFKSKYDLDKTTNKDYWQYIPKQNQQFFGGFGGGTGGGMSGAGMGQLGGMIGNIGGAVGAEGSFGKQQKLNEQQGYYDSKLKKDQDAEQMLGTTKDTVASAFGPIGQFWRGVQKAGKGIGDRIGGDAGAAISGVFSPEEATFANLTDKDLNTGQKILGTIPGVGGVIAARSAAKRLEKFENERRSSEFFNDYVAPTINNDGVKTFGDGGNLKSNPVSYDLRRTRKSRKLIQDSYNDTFRNEDGDTVFENVLEFVDPTGISSWDDVARSYKKEGFSSNTMMEMAGALPFVGRLKAATKFAKNFKKAGKAVPYLPSVLRGVDTASDVQNLSTSNKKNNGGYLDPVNNPDAFNKPKNIDPYTGFVSGTPLNSEMYHGRAPVTAVVGKSMGVDLQNPKNQFINTEPAQYKQPSQFFGKLKDGLGTLGNKMNNADLSKLRYAPIGANLMQLARMSKPEVERLSRLNNQYQKQYLDEATYENQARQQTAGAINAIGRSGVTNGQMINATLAAQLNGTRAVADGYNQVRRHNIEQEQMRQQVAMGNNQANMAQSNLEKDINARNRAAYQTNRSRLIGQLGNDFGNVGREELYKDMAISSTGYDYRGNYKVLTDPNSTPEEKAQATANIQNAEKYQKFFSANQGTFNNSKIIHPMNSNGKGGTMKKLNFKRF